MDIHLLPVGDVFQLGFLIIGNDVQLVLRNYGQQHIARFNKLTDPQAFLANHASDRGGNAGVGQVQFSHRLLSLCQRQFGIAVRQLCLQHLQHVFRRFERRFRLSHIGRQGMHARRCLLCRLQGTRTDVGHFLIAVLFLAGELQFSLRRLPLRLSTVYQ
ncbi:hypothetical protein D3C71_1732970 [compost metagenome]